MLGASCVCTVDFPGAVEDSSGEAAATGAGADVAALAGGGKGFASAFNLLVAAAAAAVGEVTGPATGGVALPGEAAARALLLVGVGCFVGRVGSLGPAGIERLVTGEALAVGWLDFSGDAAGVLADEVTEVGRDLPEGERCDEMLLRFKGFFSSFARFLNLFMK